MVDYTALLDAELIALMKAPRSMKFMTVIGNFYYRPSTKLAGTGRTASMFAKQFFCGFGRIVVISGLQRRWKAISTTQSSSN
jgi:hypothetical protein